MSYGKLLGFVRETWGRENLPRNGSIVKALLRRFPEPEVEAMVRGAKILQFSDLRIINGEAGEGRRNCMSAYYRSQTKPQARTELETVAHLLKARGF